MPRGMRLDEVPAALPEVLLADDAPLVLESLDFVRREGFPAHPVATRGAVVKIARARPATLPLALVDLGLPRGPHAPDEGPPLITQLLTISLPCARLDYAKVRAWLDRIVALDPAGQYPCLAATRLYGSIREPGKQRVMLQWVYARYSVAPGRRWLARAALNPEIPVRGSAKGAGKTTSLKALLDFIDINDGAIALFGETPSRSKARRQVAFLSERFLPSYYLTGPSYPHVMSGLLTHSFSQQTVTRLCSALELAPAALTQPVRTCSKGMSQKLGLMALLASDKPLLVLDEPLNGLEPKARALVKRELERAHADGRTLFYSSHMLADVQALDSRMVLLHGGRAAFSGTVVECFELFGARDLEQDFLRAL